ncbi:guanylate kinase [Pseudoramibacter sp.]|uniref:guanylate kinase n=1 Tax=Pseudoramibacter sp. TaxID=2034862 RepID=UPI0025DC00FD|nr:guanylate kinase [Pseudoramibacter sp.]MCH4072715.1 guanylate kinase [Pseudoramibacter sp.]MCH4106486.1 guanylate kinase [Pseudoramibacter sp.]
MKQKRGQLIILSGPSGAGKGTICEAALKAIPNLKISTSATTRKPRGTEKNGVEYFFLSEAAFKKKIENGEFLEYAKVHDHYYGTPKAHIVQMLDKGIDVILEIDVQGAAQIKEKMGYGITIFIAPPSLQELQERLVDRKTDSAEQITLRMKNAQTELKQAQNYDYIIVNRTVDQAVDDLTAILRAEKCRSLNNLEIIQEMLM